MKYEYDDCDRKDCFKKSKVTSTKKDISQICDQLLVALKAARDHLDYCGYGDRWERECADEAGLQDQIENAIKEAEK